MYLKYHRRKTIFTELPTSLEFDILGLKNLKRPEIWEILKRKKLEELVILNKNHLNNLNCYQFLHVKCRVMKFQFNTKIDNIDNFFFTVFFLLETN